MRMFKGKVIYNPTGKAAEYSRWACNFVKGCEFSCSYCYCKKGVLSSELGGSVPVLKKGLEGISDFLSVFEKELTYPKNLLSLRRHGLFFSFSSDPLAPFAFEYTLAAVLLCLHHQVPVKVLTKAGIGLLAFMIELQRRVPLDTPSDLHRNVALGITLTGCDELEGNADSSQARIEALATAKRLGFRTFVSLEPLIDPERVLSLLPKIADHTDLFKVGLLSGKKYDRGELLAFMDNFGFWCKASSRVYFKDSFLKAVGLDRAEYNKSNPQSVERDFKLFWFDSQERGY